MSRSPIGIELFLDSAFDPSRRDKSNGAIGFYFEKIFFLIFFSERELTHKRNWGLRKHLARLHAATQNRKSHRTVILELDFLSINLGLLGLIFKL